MKKVILIARAFNDLDCRLPLLDALISDFVYEARILIIPTTTSSGLTVVHPDATKVAPVEYAVNTCLGSVARWVVNSVSRRLERAKHPILRYRVWGLFWRFFTRTLLDRTLNSERFANNVGSDTIVIVDDVFLTPDRSVVISWVNALPKERVFCISHGQNTFINLWEDKQPATSGPHHRDHARHHVYMSSENDCRLLRRRMPDVSCSNIGNTRFDQEWIEKISEPRISRNQGRPTVCFMMSKMEYGLEAQSIIDTVNEIASSDQFKLVLKPHTRGMSLHEYRTQLHPGIEIAEHAQSSELIDAADIVIFTSSSVIFEAMIKKRRVLYLEAVQNYRTIFHELPSVMRWTGDKGVVDCLRKIGSAEYDQNRVDKFVRLHAQGNIADGRVCHNFITKYIELDPC